MQTFIRSTSVAMRNSPRMFLGATLVAVTGGMRAFYNWNLVKLPLNDRKAFLMLTDEETLRRSDYLCTRISQKAVVATQVDSTGHPTDAATLRVEGIMQRLIAANPELTQHLIPGARWRAVAVERPDKLSYSPASSAGNGSILFVVFTVNRLDDDELAFVIAHEMTHTIQKHESELQGTKVFFYEFFHNVLKPMTDYVPGFHIRTFLFNLEQKFNFADNTIQEREGDEFGFKFASKACFDYRKFAGILGKLWQIRNDAINFVNSRQWPQAGGQRGAQDRGDPVDEELVRELEMSEFWRDPRHPKGAERVALLGSEAWRLKAEAWRQEKGCLPLAR